MKDLRTEIICRGILRMKAYECAGSALNAEKEPTCADPSTSIKNVFFCENKIFPSAEITERQAFQPGNDLSPRSWPSGTCTFLSDPLQDPSW